LNCKYSKEGQIVTFSGFFLNLSKLWLKPPSPIIGKIAGAISAMGLNNRLGAEGGFLSNAIYKNKTPSKNKPSVIPIINPPLKLINKPPPVF